jgi:hypothetical protein
MLQGITHYMKKEAIEWDIPHGECENASAVVSAVMFFYHCRYDRPLIRDGRYRTLLMWEVTMVAKYDMLGLGGGGGICDQITKGGGKYRGHATRWTWVYVTEVLGSK